MSATTPADQRLRAATYALAEHDRLRQSRDPLAQDVAAAQHRVNLLTAELAREQRDVHDLSTGVMGFLASLAMTGELEREKREAMEAGIRLREGQAAYEAVRAQLAVLDAKLASPSRTELEAEIAAARAAKQATMQLGTPGGAELFDIAVRIESIDIELIPLEDAIAAGTAAAARLFEIVEMLQVEGERPEKGLLGRAEAAVTTFHRAVDPLGAPDDMRPPFGSAISDDDRAAWADPLLKALFGSGDRASRLAAAATEIRSRLTRLEAQLAPVRARRDELAGRRSALVSQHDRLLDPT